MNLHAAVADYLAALARTSPDGTVKSYRSLLRRFARHLPERQVGGIASRDIADFLYGPAGVTIGRAPRTATAQRAALRSFFRYAHMRGWTRALVNVPSPVFRERGPRRDAPPTRLSAAQLGQLLDAAAEPVLRGMLATAMNTALRISDVCKIELHHLDLTKGEIAVRFKKTGVQDVLPVTADLDRELRSYLTWYSQEAGVRLGERGAYLFPGFERAPAPFPLRTWTVAPERPAQYDTYRKRLHLAYEACGISVEPREAWHVIRRSVARIYFDSLREEVSHDHALKQTAALLGHQLTATTEGYLGLDAEIAARNESLRGRPFLRRPDSNIVPLRPAG